MASHRASRSRPPAPLRSQSRFAEGSMNDRTSKMPPIEFLGPELEQSVSAGAVEDEIAAARIDHQLHYHQLGYVPGAPAPRPRSASASIVDTKASSSSSSSSSSSKDKEKRGFLGPLWEGFREKLSFGKAKSRPISVDGRVGLAGLTRRGHDAASVPEVLSRLSTADDAKRPTREEILANYHQLVDSGFFSNHAIHSTRRPMPTAQMTPATAPGIFAVPSSNRNSEDVPMTNAPPPPPIPQARKQPKELPPFYVRPKADRKAKLQPFGSVPRPRPIPNNPNAAPPAPMAPPPPIPHLSDIRGKKRGHEDDDAGKARKLRKASARISADLSMPIPIPSLRKHFKRTGTDSTEDGPSLARSLPAPSMGGIFTRRSFSSNNRESNKLAKRAGNSKAASRPGSSKSGGNIPAISAPVSQMVRLPPGAFDAMREGKGEFVLAPSSVSGPAPAMSAPLTSHPVVVGRDDNSPSVSNDGSSRSSGKLSSHTSLTSSTSSSPNVIVHLPGGGEIPLWAQKQHQHMHTRRAVEPLKVVPDANRGIPKVPEIPKKFKDGRSPGAGGMHKEDEENNNVEMGTFYFEDSMLF